MSLTPSRAYTTARPELSLALDPFDLVANREGYVGLQILLPIDVQEAYGPYPKRALNQKLTKRKSTKRGSGGDFARGSLTFDFDTYSVKNYGYEMPVDHNDQRRYGSWFAAEVIAAETAQEEVLKDLEGRILDMLLGADTEIPDAGVGTGWDLHSSARPIDDIDAAKLRVRSRTGLVPNRLALSYDVFLNLRRCAQVIDAIGSTGIRAIDPQHITAEQLAIALDLENTAADGADAVVQNMFPTAKSLLFYGSDNTNLNKPRLGNVIHWPANGSQIAGLMEQYEEPEVDATIVRCRLDAQELVMLPEAAEIMTGMYD